MPSGGISNLLKNTDCCTSDLQTCGQRFHKNCPAELSETYGNNYIEEFADARSSILKSDNSAPSGGRLNFGKYTDFCTSDFHLCG